MWNLLLWKLLTFIDPICFRSKVRVSKNIQIEYRPKIVYMSRIYRYCPPTCFLGRNESSIYLQRFGKLLQSQKFRFFSENRRLDESKTSMGFQVFRYTCNLLSYALITGNEAMRRPTPPQLCLHRWKTSPRVVQPERW